MNTTGSILGCVCGLLSLIASDTLIWAQDEANPYQLIVDRNAFGLKPPPPPPEPPSTKPPPPTTTVWLTGVTSIPSIRALFVYTEQEPGKQASTKSPILREGEREGPIEVLSIDVPGSTARIKINGVETNIIFEVKKSSPTPAPGGTPGGTPPPAMANLAPNPSIPSPLGSSASAGTPTIISRNNSNDRGGVSVMGATTPTPAATPAATGISRFGGYSGNPGMYASAAPVAGVFDNGASLSLPTRTVRDNSSAASTTSGAQSTPAAKPLDPVSQIIQMRAAEMRAQQMGIPFPPSPPIPGVDFNHR